MSSSSTPLPLFCHCLHRLCCCSYHSQCSQQIFIAWWVCLAVWNTESHHWPLCCFCFCALQCSVSLVESQRKNTLCQHRRNISTLLAPSPREEPSVVISMTSLPEMEWLALFMDTTPCPLQHGLLEEMSTYPKKSLWRFLSKSLLFRRSFGIVSFLCCRWCLIEMLLERWHHADCSLRGGKGWSWQLNRLVETELPTVKWYL